MTAPASDLRRPRDAQRPDAERPGAQRPGAERPGGERLDAPDPDPVTRVLRIRRSDRGEGRAWSRLAVSLRSPRATVLDALLWARRHVDPTLDVRHSCLHGSCGTCGMLVDGTERLACVTRLDGLRGDEIVLEPLASFAPVSDLVVDLEALWEALDAIGRPAVRIDDEATRTDDGDGRPTRLEDCLECGLCVSGCPISAIDPAYAGPSVLAAAWRVVDEGGDGRREALALVDGDQGAWRCHVALECSARCPVDARPGDSIMHLRRTLLRHRLRAAGRAPASPAPAAGAGR
jgi:succinate dehydrogenase / fumarate reductase iron-sulfur subunit